MTHSKRQRNPLSHKIWATMEEIYGGNLLFHKIWATMEEIHCFTKYGLLWSNCIYGGVWATME